MSRRLFIRATGAALTATISLGLMHGCKKDETAAGGGGAKPLTIGFIYVGTKDDFGYNQAHNEGAEAVKKLPGVKVVVQENVKETDDVQKVMEGMIQEDGATLIFPTSFGYFDPHMITVAKKYPSLQFRHCGGLFDEAKHPANTGSYFGYIDECQYLAGIVAGKTTKTNKLGFIAAKPIPQVLRNINALTLGARSVNPAVTTTVIFTGGWFDPNKEAEATNSLVNQGIDVITCHVDSPKVIIENAEKRGIYSCGYHANGSALAPKGYLTGSEWNWAKVYTDYVTATKENKPLPHLVRGGLKDGFVKPSAYGPAVSAEAKTLADAAKAKAMEGKLVIFKGPLKDNKGAIVIEAGKEIAQTDPILEKMGYLVEGVNGAVN
ncbi:BMP family ABC transporter substrate-binding protein [Humisphaera borealis]|uniref:BMP family ABC transporter substrate-binding protein n=2 Tax=Humisphaera borealis TaxID=2807512 RepID=A0A7M2X4I7_9BACT|nr:BMP family ABC transporter substrate-binding protein [Humisphaera borealis]